MNSRCLFIVAIMAFAIASSFPQASSDILPQQTYIRTTDEYGTTKWTFSTGEEIYVHFYIEWAGGQSYSIDARITEFMPDGSAQVVFESTIGTGQDIVFSGTAGPPAGTRILVFEYSKPVPEGVFWAEAARCQFNVLAGPADLVVAQCWVSPTRPKQEDAVTFYAIIANIGGSDAYNFRVELYLDGNLYDSNVLSLRAGEDNQISGRSSWTAEDGPHTARWAANPDRSVQESNYGNNECSTSFSVSPRTVTETVTVTKTSTRTQSQRTTTTITATRTSTIVQTTETTVQRTTSANPIITTTTLTGLVTSTVYSPTVTTTIVAAQMILNPVPWFILSTLGMIGAVLRIPKDSRPRRFCRRVARIFPVPQLPAWLTGRQVRKALFAVCLISMVVLSIAFQAGQEAYGSTVTTTRTATSTEWATITQSLTSTRYSTSMTTDTSTFTRTQTGFTRITPTKTVTVDRRSTTTIYTTTTKTTIVPKTGGVVVTIDLDESFQDAYGDYRYYISQVNVFTSDSSPHEFNFQFPMGTFPPKDPSFTIPSSIECQVTANCVTGQLVPKDQQLQPINFNIQVSGEDSSLNPLTFSIDLSNFEGDQLTIRLGKKEFNEVFISEIEPPGLKPVSQGLERYIDMSVSPPRDADFLNGLRALLGWGRIYYYDVNVRVADDSPYSAIITTFTASVDNVKQIKKPRYELKDVPALEGELQRSYDDIAEAAFGGGPAGIGSDAVETAIAFAEKSPLASFYLKDVVDGTVGEIRKQFDRHQGVDLTTSGGCFTVAPRIRVRPFMIGLGEVYVPPILGPGEEAKFTVTFEETHARSAAGIKPIFMVTFTGVESLVNYKTVKWNFLAHYVNTLLAVESHVTSFTYSSKEVTAEGIPT